MKKITFLLLFISTVCLSQTVDTVYMQNAGTGNYVKMVMNITNKRALPASLGTGTATSTKVLYGNQVWKEPTGYTISFQALTSSPVDAQTIYFGKLPKAPVTVAATSKIYIRKAGIIKIAEIYSQSGTAGTNEAWPMYIRLNNTTDTQIASVSLATSERIWSNSALSIAVVAGDYIEIKSIYPTWVTNPLTFIPSGYIYIE